MAVLTRPLFHSQERVDLEDLNQLLSGLRTDARLWTRQVYADKNFIVKGFDVSGLGTDSLTVNLLDSTLLFAGKQDLRGSAAITVTGIVTAGTVITFNNSVTSSTVILTEGTDWDRDDTNTAQTAANLATAIDANGNFSASSSGDTISIEALNTGFTTIIAAPFSGFSSDNGTLSTFIYPTDLQESPADLSYFVIESDATGADAQIVRAISASERASVGTASKTLFIYGTLVTEQNTPITKAFWDPSANSGAGAEFNQRVNTAVDLSINLLVSESKLNTDTEANAATFFANVPICEVEVDTSGIILSIRDTRPILFEADDTREWNRTNAFATVTMANTTATPITGVTITNGLVPNGTTFVTDEIVDFTTLDATNVVASASVQEGGTLNIDNAIVLFDKFDLSTIGSFKSIAQGRTSGAIRVVNMVDSNFFRDDKDIGDWRNAFSALATEIRNVKGSARWYEDPAGTVKDVLRFINSTVIGVQRNARYEWNAADAGDATLDIRLDPINDPSVSTQLTVLSANATESGDTVTFTRTASNLVLTAITTGSPSDIQFLRGSDAEATASNIAGAINGNGFPGLTAIFAEDGTTGNYIVSLFSNDRTISDVAASRATAITVQNSPFMYLGENVDLANIRFYGIDRAFTFREATYTLARNEVLFVTLPDLNVDTSTAQLVYENGTTQFRYSVSGPTSGATWNATNRDIWVNSTTIVKSGPIDAFECNGRNYWIAYRDEAETVFVRDVGELGDNESANIGQGISNATLSYIGAPNDTTSTPDFPSVTTINAFSADGSYLAGNAADFNESIIAQAENLTSSISDLNNHLTEVRDLQYQNLGLKLIEGGFFTWEASSGTLSWSMEANIQVPGRPDSANAIAAGNVVMATGTIAFVDINRNSSVSATLTPTAVAVDSFIPQRDRVVIARRLGDFIFVGINGSIRLADSESAPLDSALQFIGLKDNELPRQLNTHISASVTGLAVQSVDVGTADVLFPVGGLSTSGTFDDNITLSLSINSGVLFWEGITIDLINGRLYNEGSNPLVNFRGRPVSDTTFAIATIANDGEVYYAISLTGETTISADNASTIDPGAANGVDAHIGRKAGEIDIAAGVPGFTNPTGSQQRAVPPEFGGDLPVAVIKVSRVGSALQILDASDLIVLGASGSGGGGTGDANQDLNNYLNRLNGSTFGYLTPVIAAVSTSDEIDLTNTTAGLAASGFTLQADQSLFTTTLLDPEFIVEGLIPDRVEVESIFGEDSAGLTVIDPSAKYFISFNSADAIPTVAMGVITPNGFTPITTASSKTISGWINSGGTLIGTNLTGNTDVNIIFAENHGLSTGQKINFPTGFATLDPAVPGGEALSAASVFYVHVVDADSFDLHPTHAGADSANPNDRLALSGTTFGSVILNRDAGVIDRVGVTNTLRGVFDTGVDAINGLSYTDTDGSIRSGALLRLAIFGDTDADIRSQENNALMTSLALFYADELGVEGVNPNGLDDVNDILRSSHLVNSTNANASYGVAGRGVVLLNEAGINAEIALDTNNDITIDGTAPIVTNGATTDQILSYNGTSFVPTDTAPASQQLNLIQALGSRSTTETAGTSTPSQQAFTWVVPPGVDNIFVIMAGAGSSGSGQSNGNVGGSAGSFFQDWLRVVPGQTYTINVGNGSLRSDGGNNRHQGGGNTFIQGSATALIDGQASVRIEASGAPGDDSAGSVGLVQFNLGTNTYTVPTNLNNIDGGVDITRFFSSNALGGFLPAYGKLQQTDWANILFRTTNSGTIGGDTALAARANPADFGLAQAGGGAGFLAGENPNINSGFGRASGPGGIRIGWYSNSEFATAHPFV